jgi:hypothetical protein
MVLARAAMRLLAAAALLVAGSSLALTTEQIASDTAMNALIQDHVFTAEGRIGNRALNGTFELDLGKLTSAPAVTKQYVWPNATAVPFTLSFNGTTATFSAGGHTMTYAPTGTIDEIFVRTRATVAGSSILVDNLVLNGETVGASSQAETGRWTTKDPLRMAGGVNLFVYAVADPVNRIDSNGQLAIIINASRSPVRSSFTGKSGSQVAFTIPPKGTSASTTADPDTVIFGDGTVVKIPDGSVVLVGEDGVTETFEQSDLDLASPISRLVDESGLSGLIGSLFGRPDLSFAPSVVDPAIFGGILDEDCP